MESLITGLLFAGVVLFFIFGAAVATQKEQSKSEEDD